MASSQGSQGPALRAPVASAEETRDRIISTYREEIKAHQAHDRDFRVLQEHIAELQRRIRTLEGDLKDSQTENEDRLSGQAKAITHLNGDIDQLKKGVHERQQEGIRVYDEIQTVKRSVEEKVGEIFHHQRDLEGLRAHNDQLRRETDFVQSDIHQNQDLRKR